MKRPENPLARQHAALRAAVFPQVRLHNIPRGQGITIVMSPIPDPDFIVTELVAVNPDGSQFDIIIRIGKPFVDDGPHVCVTQMAGVDDKPRRTYGEGPMQALHLALQRVRENLAFVEQRGARVYLRGEDLAGEPFDWRRFWYGEGNPQAK